MNDNDTKFYYEVVNTMFYGQPAKMLFGPLENIKHAVPKDSNTESKYKFAKVIDGRPEKFFQEHEILVTNKPV